MLYEEKDQVYQFKAKSDHSIKKKSFNPLKDTSLGSIVERFYLFTFVILIRGITV